MEWLEVTSRPTSKSLVGLVLQFERLGLVLLGDLLVEDEIVVRVRVHCFDIVTESNMVWKGQLGVIFLEDGDGNGGWTLNSFGGRTTAPVFILISRPST